MNIFHKVFNEHKSSYRFCVGCKEKKREELFFISDNLAGICKECAEKICFTKEGSSFEAVKPVEYILSPMEYRGVAPRILKDLKFGSNFKNADIVNLIMSDFLSKYTHLSEFDYIIPIPLSLKRTNNRGFNQAELIAKSISKQTNIPVLTDNAIRTKHTSQQSSLKYSDRLRNVQDAFKIIGRLNDKNIIIVDDIYTTGQTMKSFAQELKNAGANHIIGITAAINLSPEPSLFDILFRRIKR